MENVYKLTAGCIVAVIMIVTVRHRSGELALALSLGTCAVLLFFGMDSFKTAGAWLKDVYEKAEIQSSLTSSVIKVCGIGILSQMAVVFCADAGEQAVAKIVELCAGAMAVCAMLPLLDSVMETIGILLGG